MTIMVLVQETETRFLSVLYFDCSKYTVPVWRYPNGSFADNLPDSFTIVCCPFQHHPSFSIIKLSRCFLTSLSRALSFLAA